jgi:hypothetical protein
MGGKSQGGGNTINNKAFTQGGPGFTVADPAPPTATATSGATEPAWPAAKGATVADGGVVWTAILARVWIGAVYGVLNRATIQITANPYPDHYFQYGTLKFLTGLNAGFVCDIRDHLWSVDGNPAYLMLLEAAPNPIQVGDAFQATVGCAKIRNTCQRFNNLDNYRGFPDMPTEDRALSTPNQSNQGYAPKTTK